MNGFETKELVLAQLKALRREKATAGYSRADVAHNPQHRAAIEEQIKLFENELKRLEKAGDPVEGRRSGRSTLIKNATTGETFTEWIN
jgi:hypothetical protein